MQQLFPMSALECGQRAVVRHVDGKGAMYERLCDLGFTSGCPVECLFASVFGDPKAYLIRQTVIALRKRDADMIECLPAGGEK